jgi:tripartite-type tricarboxylate transporter receptor subunit TctC
VKTFLNRRSFCAFSMLSLATIAHASDAKYPSRPITLIVPYPAGGNADNIARVFSKKLSDMLAVPVLVDNRPGGSGTIGATQVYRAVPDGYTLLLTVTSQLTGSVPGVKPVYTAVKDFVPLVGLTIAPLALVVPTRLDVKTMKDLEALAQKRSLSYGSYGTATSTHVVQRLLTQQFKGKEAVHIPYKGEAPMVADMLGGQIDMGLVAMGQAREMEKSGRLRTLAVLGAQRSEFLPGILTLTEQGYKQMDWSYGTALYGSSRLPAAIQAKLREAGATIMADPDTQHLYRAQSNQPWIGAKTEELSKRMVSDTNNWNKVLASIGPLE